MAPVDSCISRYGHDLVVAISQKSIEGTFISWLMSFPEDTTPISWVAYLDSNKVVSFLDHKLWIQNHPDPAKFPHGSHSSDVEALRKHGFICMMTVVPGIHKAFMTYHPGKGWQPDKMPAPIFDPDRPSFGSFCQRITIHHVLLGTWTVQEYPNCFAPILMGLNIKSGRIELAWQVRPPNAVYRDSQFHDQVAWCLGYGVPRIWKAMVDSTPCLLAIINNTEEYKISDLKWNVTSAGITYASLNLLAKFQGSVSTTQKFDHTWAYENSGGTIALSRIVVLQHLVKELLPRMKRICCLPKCNLVYIDRDTTHFKLDLDQRGQTPQSISYGDDAAFLHWHSPRHTAIVGESTPSWRSEMQSDQDYQVCIQLKQGTQLFVHQCIRMFVWLYHKGYSNGSHEFLMVRTTQTYKLAVNAYGTLTVEPEGKPFINDTSEYFGRGTNWGGHTGRARAIGDDIKTQLGDLKNTLLRSVELGKLQTLIYPGSKSLTFSTAQITKGLDICADITLVDLSGQSASVAEPSSVLEEADEVDGEKLLQMGDDAFAAFNQIKSDTPATEIDDQLKAEGVDESASLVGEESVNPAEVAISALNVDAFEATTLSTTTELMQNYVAGGLINPQDHFKALQVDGRALLFHKAGDAINVAQEVPKSSTGWTSTCITSGFNHPIKYWDVSQSAMNGSISIAIVVEGAADNHSLWLSLGNNNISAPQWKLYAHPKPVSIVGVYFSEITGDRQYTLVDVKRQGTNLTDRWLVEPTGEWFLNKLPFDVEAGSYQSCTGRAKGKQCDGIYTAGVVGGLSQCAYVPFFGIRGAPPRPIRFKLSSPPTAIAAARSGLYSDFYAVVGKRLIQFDHIDSTAGNPLFEETMIEGTSSLVAVAINGMTTLFGKNPSNQVWYTTKKAAWSPPVVILSGIERISSYINKQDGGNTIFAAGGGQLHQLFQTSAIWQSQQIVVNVETKAPTQQFLSYTTVVNSRPGDVTLTAKARTPVYIDGMYYVLSAIPIKVPSSGSLTIVQATEDIVGASMKVEIDGQIAHVDPTRVSLDKLAKFSDVNNMREAKVPSTATAGGVVGQVEMKKLFGGSDDELNQTAGVMKDFVKAYQDCKVSAADFQPQQVCGMNSNEIEEEVVFIDTEEPDGPISWESPLLEEYEPLELCVESVMVTTNYSLALLADDLFRWVERTAKNAWRIVRDGAKSAWKIVCEIAGKIYEAVIDTVEAAGRWIKKALDAAKAAYDDVKRYLELLLSWDDIRNTKEMLHMMVMNFLREQVAIVPRMQGDINKVINDAQRSLAKMADIKDWKAIDDGKPAPNKETPGSSLMSGHFNNQARNTGSQIPDFGGGRDMMGALLDELVTAAETQGEVLKQTFDRLMELAQNFTSMAPSEIVVKIIAIISSAALGTAQILLNVVFKVLARVATQAIAAFDHKIHIPVLSDMLNKLGVPDVSILDIICWVGAAGFTLTYKALHSNQPPFAEWQVLAAKGAQTWDKFVEKCKPVKNQLYIAGHSISAGISYLGNILYTAEALNPSPHNSLGTWTMLMSIVAGVGTAGADGILAKHPLEEPNLRFLSSATSATTVLFKILCSRKLQGKLGSFGAKDPRQLSSCINVGFMLPALVCTCYHLHELSGKPASKVRSAAIMGEVANIMRYYGRVTYCAAVLDKNPKTKLISVGIFAGTNMISAGLEGACAGIHEWEN